MAEELLDILDAKHQGFRVELIQLVVEQQARPVAVRTPATIEPQVQRGTAGVQQTVEQLVQLRIGHPAIIVQEQPCGGLQTGQMGRQACLIRDGQAKGLRQAFTQLRGIECRACQRQPVQPAFSRGLQEAFAQSSLTRASDASRGSLNDRRDTCVEDRRGNSPGRSGHGVMAVIVQGPFYCCSFTLDLCRPP
jgi:hypothetical protein